MRPNRRNGQRRPTTLNNLTQTPSSRFESWEAWVEYHKGLDFNRAPTLKSIGRWQDGFELSPISSRDVKYRWIKARMENSIVEHFGKKIGGYEIVELYHVKNSNLWKKYSARRREIWNEINTRKVEEVRLFHGTNHADEIVRNGFKIELANDNGMFGKAIYFSNQSSKSSQYTLQGFKSPCSLHGDKLCDQCIRTLLMCRVALGNQYLAPQPMNMSKQPPSDHHCIVGDPNHCPVLRYKEYAIFDNNQAYPGHLIRYRIIKPPLR